MAYTNFNTLLNELIEVEIQVRQLERRRDELRAQMNMRNSSPRGKIDVSQDAQEAIHQEEGIKVPVTKTEKRKLTRKQLAAMRKNIAKGRLAKIKKAAR